MLSSSRGVGRDVLGPVEDGSDGSVGSVLSLLN